MINGMDSAVAKTLQSRSPRRHHLAPLTAASTTTKHEEEEALLTASTTTDPLLQQPQPAPEPPRCNVVMSLDHSYDLNDLIDNTQLPYVPLRLSQSKVAVRMRPELFQQQPQALLNLLDDDVCACLQVLPRSVRSLVRRTTLWVNHDYLYGPKNAPIVLNHSTAHHHATWLHRVRDIPEKADCGIEIYNCAEFCRMRWHWNGCGLLLHEYCHLIHQHVLGLECPDVQRQYEQAKASVRYAHALRRDWAGEAVETDLHYAMVDYKEFFAEMSVTYLASGYPHLDACRCNGQQRQRRRGKQGETLSLAALCSPPLMEPQVVARLHRKHMHQSEPPPPPPSLTNPLLAWFHPRQPRRQLPPHCNKFYPFTRGQLEQYDLRVYNFFRDIWQEKIARWKDPMDCYNRDDDDDENDERERTTCCVRCWSFWSSLWPRNTDDALLPQEDQATLV